MEKKIKIFAGTLEIELENKINEWVDHQEIISTSVSTTWLEHSKCVLYTIVVSVK